MNKVIIGDCREVLAALDENSVDSIVTDPPYGLSFMGKDWDHGVPGVEFWRQAMRVLKPGGHLLAFGGSRTFHRLAVAIEDAGFEIRDTIMWLYGSGFPKSHNLDGEWDGWGTALKPAHEPIAVARKPLTGTVATNANEYGTGALNIDGCRIPTDESLHGGAYAENGGRGKLDGDMRQGAAAGMFQAGKTVEREYQQPVGRWPANVIHDGSEEVVSLFPVTSSGTMKAGTRRAAQDHPGSFCYGTFGGNATSADTYGDKGSAARFFYCAKATKKERANSKHPTIKPLALIRYLVRLVTPPHGVSLDMFAGSGTHAEACVLEGFQYIAVEKDWDNLPDIKHRIRRAGRHEETEDDETEEKQPEQPSGSDQLALSL